MEKVKLLLAWLSQLSFNGRSIDHLFNNPDIHDKTMFLYYGDLTDSSNLNRLLEKVRPDEIYNLAA